MYIQGMAQQTQVFLLCTGFGFAAGAVWDVFRFIREAFSLKKKGTVLWDILFFASATVSSFMFLLCINDGKARLYTYLGMTAGFFIWKFTFGVPVGYLLDRFSLLVKRFLKFISDIMKKQAVKIRKIIKKTKINGKNLLKNQ